MPCRHGRVASGVGSRLRPATQLRSHRLSCVCVRSLSPRRRNARAYLGQLIPNYHSACSPVFRMPLRIHVGDENCEEVRDPRESGSQEEDPQGAICMHLLYPSGVLPRHAQHSRARPWRLALHPPTPPLQSSMQQCVHSQRPTERIRVGPHSCATCRCDVMRGWQQA